MATLLDEPLSSSTTVTISVPITKVEKANDGSVLVHGIVTNDNIDLDEQIIDKDWARVALTKWFNDYANIRQMHSTQLAPGGKGVKLEEEPDGFHLTAKVVEPTAVRLCQEGIYQAYSIGVAKPVIIRDALAKKGRVTGGIISEVSLVDFPANPQCVAKLVDDNGDVQKVFGIDTLKGREGISETLVKDLQGLVADEAVADLLAEGWDLSDTDLSLDPDFTFEAALVPFMEVPEGFSVEDDTNDAELDRVLAEVGKTLDSEVTKFVSAAQRRAYAKTGVAMPDGAFPIPDEGHLRSAIGRLGNYQGNKAAAKAHIIRRAKALGLAHLLPAKWKVGSKKTVTPEKSVLEEAIELEKAGRSEEALAKLREAVDVELADLSKQVTPVVAPVANPVGERAVTNEALQVHKVAQTGQTVTVQVGQTALSTTSDIELMKMSLGTQFKVRQLHDVLCPAYSWEAVEGAYPSVTKNGLARHLGPQALALIHQMVGNEINEDFEGQSSNCCALDQLACAYRDLVGFLASEAAEMATPDVLTAARADLHKAFSEYYPDAHPSPLTFDGSTDAHRYDRSYLTEGRASENGTDTRKKVPTKHQSISAQEFRRGPLTAGHERPSPESTQKALMAGLLSDLHDHLAAAFPELCPTIPTEGFEPLTKADRVLGLDPDQWPHGKREAPPKPAGISPTNLPGGDFERKPGEIQKPAPESDVPTPPGGAGLQRPEYASMKLSEADLTKVLSPVLDPVSTEVRKLSQIVQELTQRVEQLESAPDPSQAPWRGAVTAIEKVFSRSTQDEAQAIIEKAALERRQEEVEYLRRQTMHADPAIRMEAQTRLKKLLGA